MLCVPNVRGILAANTRHSENAGPVLDGDIEGGCMQKGHARMEVLKIQLHIDSKTRPRWAFRVTFVHVKSIGTGKLQDAIVGSCRELVDMAVVFGRQHILFVQGRHFQGRIRSCVNLRGSSHQHAAPERKVGVKRKHIPVRQSKICRYFLWVSGQIGSPVRVYRCVWLGVIGWWWRRPRRRCRRSCILACFHPILGNTCATRVAAITALLGTGTGGAGSTAGVLLREIGHGIGAVPVHMALQSISEEKEEIRVGIHFTYIYIRPKTMGVDETHLRENDLPHCVQA